MKWLSFIFAFSLLIAGAAFYWIHSYYTQPTYFGWTVEQWLGSAYLSNKPGPEPEEVRAAVLAMGTNAIPYALLELERKADKQSAIKDKIVAAMQRLHMGVWATRFYDPRLEDQWDNFTWGMHIFYYLQPDGKDVIPMLIRMYNQNEKDRLLVLEAMGMVSSNEAIPFLINESTNVDPQIRSIVYHDLGFIHQERVSVIPVLIKGLHDSNLSVRQSAVDALQDFGPDASQAIPDLEALIKSEGEALKSSPSQEARVIKEGAENALKLISINGTLFNGLMVFPEAGVAEPYDKNFSASGQLTATSKAYEYVAIALMLDEANYCAEQLHLNINLANKPDQIRRAYVGPPRLLKSLGVLETDDYSFGFSENGRLCFITKLHPFGEQPIIGMWERQLALMESTITTNAAYGLATNWLNGMSVDLDELNKQHTCTARQHYYDLNNPDRRVWLPIFDVDWGAVNKPSIKVTIYGPTAELLRLRLEDESFSKRPARSMKDCESLLAIPDSEFDKYSDAQRSNLLYSVKTTIYANATTSP